MKKRFPLPEDDKWDPYILGQPMGWKGTLVFVAIMVAAIAVLIHELLK